MVDGDDNMVIYNDKIIIFCTLNFSLSAFIFFFSDGTIREWDLVTMTSVRLLQGHKGPVKDLKVS